MDESQSRLSLLLGKAFLEALINETLIKDPRVTHQNMCRAWNRMADAIATWPQTKLTVPRYTDHYSLDWERFPVSFREDLEAFLSRQECNDIFDLDAPPQPLKPRTIKAYRSILRRAASALVHSGVDPKDITSLEVLVQLEYVQRLLRYMRERPSQPNASAGDMARLLAKIAKHWVKSEPQDVATINRWASRLTPARDGLSVLNRDRLIPFRDEHNLIKLFALPRRIRDAVTGRKTIKRSDALKIQHAVALAILTYCPLRISNLAALSFARHLRWSKPSMGGELVVVIDGSEVKNGQPMSFPLPKDCAELIKLYRRSYLPVLCPDGTDFLFPGPFADRPKRSDTLSKQLSRLVHRSVGFEVNPHLYRHLVHLIILDRYPGAYAMVSRVLAHKSIQTAIRNYAGKDIAIAMRAFQDLINDTMRGRGAQSAPTNIDAVAYGLNQGMI